MVAVVAEDLAMSVIQSSCGIDSILTNGAIVSELRCILWKLCLKGSDLQPGGATKDSLRLELVPST